MPRIIPAVLLVLLSIASARVRSDDPVSSAVTFNREVVRILQRKCLQCHSPGGIAMSLSTYRDVRPWSRAIREELVERRMPPWGAAPGYAPIADDPSLTAREMAVLLTWLDGGVPRGEERDLPAPVAGAAPPASSDHLVRLPEVRIPADEDYVVHRVTVDAGANSPRRITRIEVRPGERRALRAAFVSVVTPRGTQWIGAWTPWRPFIAAPDGAAFTVPAGAKIEAELHYRGGEAEARDLSSIALIGASGEADAVRQIVIAAGPTARGRSAGVMRLREPQRVWAIVPQSRDAPPADPGGSLEVTAREPDGTVQVLLWVPRSHPRWPTPYVLEHPIELPAGTELTAVAAGVPLRRVTLATTATRLRS